MLHLNLSVSIYCVQLKQKQDNNSPKNLQQNNLIKLNWRNNGAQQTGESCNDAHADKVLS